ncbi:MAG: methyltransferase RsmF C-terminal domain-like protein [Prevotella fusca]|uniref:methyltransferase RsmF C-terminal domain-like protein n=1 Tax=Prevotella fusca TaxID=589436 RepID=UPI003F9EEF4F
MIKDNSQPYQATQSPCSFTQEEQETRTIEEVEKELPLAFTTYTRELFGDELYQTFLKGLQVTPPVSIRLNPFKLSEETNKINPALSPQPIPWCKEGFWLETRPNFTFDPLLHAGVYYVQEASSMFLSHVLQHLVKEPVMALDLCAAPGGKTTCARTSLPAGSFLFSNEPIGKRAQILAENVQKFGHEDVIVTNNYPRDYKKSKLSFDVIIADVPCSGEGMFRKDPHSIEEWSPQNVENCWQLQRSIIADIWNNLKSGGILIYSTCTFNAHEDEENIAWILNEYDAELLSVPTEEAWNITGSLIGNPLKDGRDFPVYRFIPGKTHGEGIFMAIIRKRGDNEALNNKATLEIDKAIAEAHKRLRILSHGVKEGTQKGKNIIPDHTLALSFSADKSAYPNVEVDYQTAIAYLRHEAIVLSSEAPRGIVLLTYKGHPIGFAKNLGTRANNLYPLEWRIKSTHIPDEPLVLL